MNAKQEQAVRYFRRFLEDKCATRSTAAPLSITKFEQTPTNYGTVWVSAELERTTLSEDNLLRALDHEYWHVHIGVKGGIKVHSAPRSYEQFSSRRAFGMKFKLSSAVKARKQYERAQRKAGK